MDPLNLMFPTFDFHDRGESSRFSLVRHIDCLGMGGGDGFEKIDPVFAGLDLHQLPHYRMDDLLTFLIRCGLVESHEFFFHPTDVLARVERLLQRGYVVAVRPSKGGGEKVLPATVLHRQLIRSIDRKTRGRLSFQGREYTLVAGADEKRVPQRDAYEVVPKNRAVEILRAMGEQPNQTELADLLQKAAGQLSRDWRAPFSPDGIVLLRRQRIVREPRKADAQPMTPSQMKALRQTDWIEIEVVDQDGEPHSVHYRLELADSGLREGDLSDDGCLAVSAIEPGSCKLTLGDIKLANDFDQPAE